ncbi:MAG: zinc-ribbon and DUF3426 domain-containing protein [Aquimonas sp.]|nr:zinc-ribbon and DUF3426 domain-containing protein [Aquimonas sp.]
MFTQCPHCLSVHALTAADLAVGRGRLRCGVCETEFDALERLADTAPQAASGLRRSEAAPPRVIAAAELGMAPADPARPKSAAISEPAFTRGLRNRAPLRSGPWWLASAALGLLLSTQIVLAQRAELSQDPSLRPWLQRLCSAFGCDLPAYSDPTQIRLLHRDVGPHPSVPDALLVTASFRSEAPWPQAWPVLELSMSDLEGRLVALRRFGVSEYLGQPPEQPTLPPGQPVMVELELLDPGNQAIAFEFGFL